MPYNSDDMRAWTFDTAANGETANNNFHVFNSGTTTNDVNTTLNVARPFAGST
jgi:hypothetical protein